MYVIGTCSIIIRISKWSFVYMQILKNLINTHIYILFFQNDLQNAAKTTTQRETTGKFFHLNFSIYTVMSKINRLVVFFMSFNQYLIFWKRFLASKTWQNCECNDVLIYYVDSEFIMIIFMFQIPLKNGSLKMTELSQYCLCWHDTSLLVWCDMFKNPS